MKLVKKFKLYIWRTISGIKVSKRVKKCWKKPHIWLIMHFSKKFVLASLKYINSYNMMKKNWCHYITLGLIFSRLVKLTYHFLIYSQQLSTTSENEKWIFLANKSLGTVHMLPVFSRKKLILWYKISKKF